MVVSLLIQGKKGVSKPMFKFFKKEVTMSATNISPLQLQKNLSAGAKPVLLDVREADELAGPLGHLDGIVHIPLGKLGSRMGELAPHKTEEIVVVCRSGARASSAARSLKDAGFSKVIILDGGMMAWREQIG